MNTKEMLFSGLADAVQPELQKVIDTCELMQSVFREDKRFQNVDVETINTAMKIYSRSIESMSMETKIMSDFKASLISTESSVVKQETIEPEGGDNV